MIRLILTVACTVLFSGCAQYQAQQRAEAQRQEMEAASRSLAAACAAAYNDPAMTILHPKIPFSASDATLAQLGDVSKASAKEKAAIEEFDRLVQPCTTQGQAFFRRFDYPGMGAAYQRFTQEDRSLRASLWAGSITFGEFNTRRGTLVSQFEAARAAAAVEASRAATIAAQQERANSLQTLQVIQQMQQNQQLQQANQIQSQQLYQMRTPTQTNCYRYGNQVNCTSY